MKYFVYIECQDGQPLSASLEALTPAAQLGEAVAVTVGSASAAAAVAAYGVPVMDLDAEPCCPDRITAALESVIREQKPDGVLFAATQAAKDLAPRLAARLDGGCVTDATGLEVKDGKLICTRPAYGGTILERLAVTAPAFVTLRSGSYAKPAQTAPASVETVPVTIPDGAVKAKLMEAVTEISEAVDLEGADIVVAGGRGMGSAEGFRLVEELAALLGGVVGASRPAIEEGWISRAHQVGQSGKMVSPKLYIACGISGAMQHISGAMGSKFIVAINKDESAPIFSVADVGIVGDALEIIPALMDELRKRG